MRRDLRRFAARTGAAALALWFVQSCDNTDRVEKPVDELTDRDTVQFTDPDPDVPESDTEETDMAPTPADGIEQGDLVITELMIGSESCPDAQGEYVEIFNTTNRMINLRGLVFQSGATRYTVPNDTFLDPQRFAVGFSGAGADCGYSFEYIWRHGDAVQLANGGSRIALKNRLWDIDVVDTSGWRFIPNRVAPPGRSLQLDPAKQTVADNDAKSAWCLTPVLEERQAQRGRFGDRHPGRGERALS